MSPAVYPVEGREWILDKGSELFPPTTNHPLADLIVDIIDGWGEDDEDRRALEMHAWQRATYAEIAEEFGLSGRPSGFYRVQRALDRLREEMEDMNVTPYS